MKKYFQDLADSIDNSSISQEEIEEFRTRVIQELDNLGGSSVDKGNVQDASIRNAIRQNCTPKGLAEAILE